MHARIFGTFINVSGTCTSSKPISTSTFISIPFRNTRGTIAARSCCTMIYFFTVMSWIGLKSKVYHTPKKQQYLKCTCLPTNYMSLLKTLQFPQDTCVTKNIHIFFYIKVSSNICFTTFYELLTDKY